MDQIYEFADERHKSLCIHCGCSASVGVSITRDHVPTKALLCKPYPENLPIVVICAKCNNDFSADEEYLSVFLQCAIFDSTNPELLPDKVVRALQRNPKLRARVEQSKMEYQTVSGETRCFWRYKTEAVENIVVKNARGHVLYECGEPIMGEPTCVWTLPLAWMTAMEREKYNTVDWAEVSPEVGSRMMQRIFTEQDMRDGWIIVQDGIYRFHVDLQDRNNGILVKSVLSEHLATKVLWSDY